ncbi:hypothetical protein Ccrd_018943 [Cynara cardunculus var. scolymus]|uniref:DUF7054 domain-containing protein n=1 Tax=Cynara cardunculus var. scolymus TaxID=59895 RepID=A0A103Y597_CYNCS|nr:hypothetical protein Ccrd_018943 [Cynara cardunculus var. scolymus]
MMSKISKKKKKNDQCLKKNRVLITVNVIGSPGPLRLLVNEDDTVSTVIESSLKLYARGGRLPILGSDFKNFVLYVSNARSDGSKLKLPFETLSSSEAIGLSGGRIFVMSKKKAGQQTTEGRSDMITRQPDVRSWKSWLNSLNKLSFKVISH